jgi:hypothetical protein
VLKKYTTCGWSGGTPADKYQKNINLHKVKAEMAYSAEDYFSTVYELITGRPDVNLDDLSGTELEEAETSLFRASIAESIRATMWYGDTNRDALGTFDGFLKRICEDVKEDTGLVQLGYLPRKDSYEWAEKLLKDMWENSTEELRALRSENNLVYFVSSDVYNAYEESLDNVANEAAYLAKQTGREGLFYRGIPVVDVQMNGYKEFVDNLPHSFAILTDRRNLALAVNTSDFPGTEVRMWYNPDLMENRQRAIFMAGCDYLLPELVTVAVGVPFSHMWTDYDNGIYYIQVTHDETQSWGENVKLYICDYDGELKIDGEDLYPSDGMIDESFTLSSFSRGWLEIGTEDGFTIKYIL